MTCEAAGECHALRATTDPHTLCDRMIGAGGASGRSNCERSARLDVGGHTDADATPRQLPRARIVRDSLWNGHGANLEQGMSGPPALARDRRSNR
jgi:hypothetical protein